MTPQRFTSMTRRHLSRSPRTPAPPPIPALFISSATSPKSERVKSFRRSTSAASLTSTTQRRTSPERAASRDDLLHGRFERGGVGVGHDDLHAEAGEFFGGGKTDAARRAGDDRDPAGARERMERHGEAPFRLSVRACGRRLAGAKQRLDPALAPHQPQTAPSVALSEAITMLGSIPTPCSTRSCASLIST